MSKSGEGIPNNRKTPVCRGGLTGGSKTMMGEEAGRAVGRAALARARDIAPYIVNRSIEPWGWAGIPSGCKRPVISSA